MVRIREIPMRTINLIRKIYQESDKSLVRMEFGN